MKKILIPLSLVLLALSLLAGCTDPDVEKETTIKEETTSAPQCLDHSFGEGVVTKVPTCTVPGVMTYTCLECGEVIEEAIPVNDDHSFALAGTKVEPTCLEVGESLYKCVECGIEKTEELSALGHSFEVWETITAPTYNEVGLERSECTRCGTVEEREIEKLVAPFYIILDLNNGEEPIELGVGDDGVYSIDPPEKIGYNFICWKDADGNVVPGEGTTSGDLYLIAEWELDGTDTLEKLIERAAAGVDRIRITADIIVTEPIFVVGETRIYSDGNFIIKRDPDYAGDIFVIGQNSDGLSSAVLGMKTKLTLGGGEGVLTIDGNREKINVTVLGSALFISDSAIVDLYDGLIIANNKKLGNERTFTCDGFASEIATTRPGGAAILLMNGVVNMYGGIIENNISVTEYTVEVSDDGTEILHEDAGCGGAIYNRGNFNMYGGIIRGNEALRGGGIYNDEIVNLVSGTISGNKSHSYGGAVSSSAAADSQMFIGQSGESDKVMLFDGNNSLKAGGVLYSNTSSPIIIYGNTVFSNNKTESSGGAIYTGGALTLRGAEFIGNECAYSGGAVYLHYSNPDYARREMEITDCRFSENTASIGGAIILSAAATCTEQGTYATIKGCSFNNNYARRSETQAGNGGAIYITRKSEARIDSCQFVGNKADTNAGAVAIHSEAVVDLINADFTDNSAALGGAIYTSSGSVVALETIRLGGNKAILKENGSGGNGGALYIQDATVSLKSVEFDGNSAENNAGAIYQCGVKIEADETVSFKNNSAKNHGGAVYITYLKIDEENRVGGQFIASNVTFANNTAIAGGAVSARTDSVVELNNVSFVGNTTPDAEAGTSNGGGAIYANNTSLKLVEVVMNGNSSGYYGGAIKADTCDILLKDSQIIKNAGGTGGAIYASGGSLDADGFILKDNTSALNGVVYLTKITATIKNLEASGNKAVVGGALYTSSLSEVKVEASEFNANEANRGGALCVAGESKLEISDSTFEKNLTVSGNGGAIYVTGAELKIGNEVRFDKNSAALHGGAIYVTDHSYIPEVPEGDDGNGTPDEVVVKSVFTVDGASFNDNNALRGGAIYVARTEYSVNNSEFNKNIATDLEYGGGAIYSTMAAGELSDVVFAENCSNKGGAIALHSTSSMTVSSMTAYGNEARVNADGKVGHGGVFFVNNSTLSLTVAEKSDVIAIGNAESGNAAQSGGAIFAENLAVVSMSGASFVNNSAKYGGAIYVSGTAALSLDDVELSGNKAVADATQGGGNGGALYTNMASVTLKNTEFSENSAELNAGAIYLSATSVELDNTVSFKSNSAKNHGGAIYVVYKRNSDETLAGGRLKAVGTVFDGNTALSGGAISARSESVLELIDASFRNNTAPEAKVGTSDGGGAIYSNNSSLSLSGVVMEGNTSGYYGGAIKSDGCTLGIKNTSITGSEGGTGGAIYATGGTLNAEELTISKNKSSLNGVIYLKGCEAVLSGLRASNNEAVSGGVIFASNKSSVDLSESEFNKNTASKGGAIYAASASVAVSNSSFTENVTDGKGGAVCLTEGSNMSANGITFNKNLAGGNGGAILLEGSSLVFGVASSFESNASGNYGGAICVLEYLPEGAEEPIKSSVTVSNVSFKSNEALRGGALYVAKNDYIITDSEFVGNAATDLEYGGGAVYSTESHGVIEGVSLVGNTSHKGGAIALHSTSRLTVTSMVATGNSATLNEENRLGLGGVFFVNNSTLDLAEGEGKSITLGGSDGLDNLAHSGGAIHAENGAEIIVSGASFIANKAYAGGAIYAKGGKATLSGCEFIENHATSGGAIDAYAAEIDIVGGIYTSNSASAGGAINASSGCEISVSGAVMSGNRSDYVQQSDGYNSNMGGGAIAAFNSSLVLTGVTLEGNTTGYYGGAILASGCEINVSDSYIRENLGGTGAALYFKGSCSVTLSESEITDNVADANGTIYVNHSTLELSGVNATENLAKYGGLVYASGSSEVRVRDSALNNNLAVSGGVIYADNATVTVSGSSLNYNGLATDTLSGASLGGAILARVSTVEIIGSEFIGNRAAENGGAICLQGSRLTIEDADEKTTLFKENGAAGHAGAIYVSYFEQKGEDGAESTVISGILTALGGRFESNTAMGGGAISIRSSCEANISDAVFVNNGVSGYNDLLDGNGEGGGAIYVGYGALTLNNVIMTQNIATESLGGAVNAYHGVLNVIGGELAENTALGGGAILLIASDATVTDTRLIRNKALSAENYHGGGAINAEYGALTVSGAIIEGNESAYYGGAINARRGRVIIKDKTEIIGSVGETGAALYFRETGTDVTLTDIVVSGNEAKSNGVIYMTQSGKLTVNGLEVTDNKAYQGGVFYVSGGKITLEGVAATANHATNGGVIFVTGSADVEVKDSLLGGLEIVNETNILANTAKNGGAVYAAGGKIALSDTVICGNIATQDGGAIYTSSSTVNIIGGSLNNNSAVLGGAIYATSESTVNITDTGFTENYASNNGGAICAANATVNINGENTLFSANGAASYGGAIYLGNQIVEEVSVGAVLNMNGGTFRENTALAGGAICGRTASYMTLIGTKLIGNSATGETTSEGGGAIFSNSNTVVLSGVELKNNTSAYYGGALAFLSANVTVKDDSVIDGNTGTTGGAVEIRNDDGIYNFTDVILTNNNGKGSGVFYVTSKSTVNISGLTASGNSANYGGVFYVSGSSAVSISDSIFTSNSATVSGGAIDHRSSGKLTVTNTSFISNTAGVAGGAISANGTGEVEITDCIFTENRALAAKNADANVSKISRGGGAIFVTGKATVTVNGGSFISNSAAGEQDVTTADKEMTDAGGAIIVDGGKLTVIGASFSKNTASNGAAIGTSRSKTTEMYINSCSFTENVSKNNGAAIYIQNGVKNETDSIFIDSCSFENNTATEKTGSSVYIRTNSSATITNVTSTGGTDKYGNAFYVTGGARVTLGGTVSLSGDKVYLTGSGTGAIVNYKTDAEKTAWESVITTVSSATVSYVASEQ